MRPLWTPPTAGECRHFEPAETCPICHPHTSWIDDARVELLLLVVLVAVLSVFGADSWQRELAFDDAVSRTHVTTP